MPQVLEQFLPVSRGGIVYDAARLRKPEAAMFTRDYWQVRGALQEFSGGRGTVCSVRSEQGDFVLRHYKRGGFAARVSEDCYLWLGANATRALREWRLLARLYELELPVPAPIAARYERHGLLYRADIMTERLAHARTLAQIIAKESLATDAWHSIGRTIGSFHSAGVHHADLNANNIMLDEGKAPSEQFRRVYLIDFDRGRIRARGNWEQTVIARLKRSLDKLCAANPEAHFTSKDWQALLEGVHCAPG